MVDELLEKVEDRKSFIEFIGALIQDRNHASQIEKSKTEEYRFNGAYDWQNLTIQDYLEAAVRWLEDITWKDENPNEITWKKKWLSFFIVERSTNNSVACKQAQWSFKFGSTG